MDQEQYNQNNSYVYHTPSSDYDYPNKPYEPFEQPKSPKPKKKRNRRLVLSITAGSLFLIIGLILSYLYIPSVKRMVIKNFCSTDKYYLYIESDNIKHTVDSLGDFSKYIGQTFTKNRSSTPSQGSIDLMYNTSLQESMSLEKNLSFSYTNEPDQDSSRTSMHLASDKINLLDVDYVESAEAQYLYFPQLASKYLDITKALQALFVIPEDLSLSGNPSSSSLTSSYLNNQELFKSLSSVFNEDTVTTLFDRYGKSFAEKISIYSDITLEENVSVNLADYIDQTIKNDESMSLDCDKFVVSITRDNAIVIAQNLLTQLKTDSDIVELVEAAGVDRTYFNILLGYLSVALETLKTDSKDIAMTMEVYTINGEIVYRKIIFPDYEDYEFVYSSYFTNATNFIYLSCGNNTIEDHNLSLCITYSTKQDAATGTGYASLMGKHFLIKFTDLGHSNSAYSIFPTGDITILPEDSAHADGRGDTILTYHSVSTAKQANTTITLADMDTTFFRLNCLFTSYEGTGVTLPKDSSTIVDCMDRKQLEKYLQNASMDTTLDAFSDTFSTTINRNDIIAGVLSFMDDNIYNTID